MLRILPKPVNVSFTPPTHDFPTPPIGLVADTLNVEHVDWHRTSTYTRDKYFIHVSDLMQVSTKRIFCAREHAISFIEGRSGSSVRKVSAGMRLLHRIGNVVQEHITNDFIDRSPHGHKVWGNWRCVCGHTTVKHSLRPAPGAGTCTRCMHDPKIYCEITLLLKKYNVVGHPDLIILWNNVLHFYEIKTIDREAVNFETLDAPLGDHTLQATFYYWIALAMHQAGELPYPPDPHIRYIYADRSNKKLFFGRPYKEFTKRASAGERIKPMLDNAALLKDSLDKLILPRRICSHPNNTRAKDCKVCVSCFNRTKDRINVQL